MEWREAHDIERVRSHYASPLPSYTVFEQATGGCLDTISAAPAGFQHLGGTEDVEAQRVTGESGRRNSPLGQKKVPWALKEETCSYCRVVHCWEMGDPTSRSRLFIVGLRADLFSDLEYEWPSPRCDDSWYPTARDVAVPDSENIGYAGTPEQQKKGDAGYSKLPFNIQGWDGVWATQMATNGGSRRPRLAWQPGEAIDLQIRSVLERARIEPTDHVARGLRCSAYHQEMPSPARSYSRQQAAAASRPTRKKEYRDKGYDVYLRHGYSKGNWGLESSLCSEES